MFVEIRGYSFCLVTRDGVDIAKSAPRGVRRECWVENGGLRVIDCVSWVDFGGADAGDEGAGTGPGGVEDVSFRAETAGWAVGAAKTCGIVCLFIS
jgi:hypothetical protein